MSGSGISRRDDPANASWGRTEYVEEGYLGCRGEVHAVLALRGRSGTARGTWIQ